jgi:hypothetical protein
MAFYILNTNRDNNGNVYHDRLVNEGIAAATCTDPDAPNTRWKYLITTLKKGDCVFLYGNREGIVACGQITGELLTEDCGCYDYIETDGMYYKKLLPYIKLKTPITSAKINQITERNVVLNPTLVHLSDEEGHKLFLDVNATMLTDFV